MKLLRYLKVLSATIGAVAVVGALMVFALVSREALVDYLPALRGILPAPEEKPQPVESKVPVVAAVKKSESAAPLAESITESAPLEDDQFLAQDEPEKPSESSEQPVEELDVEVDLDDPEVLRKLSEQATDLNDLRRSGKRGSVMVSNREGPYTGWAKKVWSKNGQLEELGRYENGLREGLWVEWKDGRKRSKGHYKNGRQDGLWTHWKSNGVIAKEFSYAAGKKVRQPVRKRMDERRLKWWEMLEERDRIRQERLPRK